MMVKQSANETEKKYDYGIKVVDGRRAKRPHIDDSEWEEIPDDMSTQRLESEEEIETEV